MGRIAMSRPRPRLAGIMTAASPLMVGVVEEATASPSRDGGYVVYSPLESDARQEKNPDGIREFGSVAQGMARENVRRSTLQSPEAVACD